MELILNWCQRSNTGITDEWDRKTQISLCRLYQSFYNLAMIAIRISLALVNDQPRHCATQ
jgi:hypothetical protein